MSNRSLGIYMNRDTQETYEIFEETTPIIKPSSSLIKTLSQKKYTTMCGLNAREMGSDLMSFRLLGEIIVHQTNT